MGPERQPISFPAETIAAEVAPGIRMLPVIHERVDFASIVRLVLDELRPDAVAVELPTTLTQATSDAVSRLPEISVVLSSDIGEDPLVWVVIPGDPIVEAIRWALEEDRPSFLIDPDIRYRPRHADPTPDPDAVWRMDPGEFFDAIRRIGSTFPETPDDSLREQGMAYHLREAAASVDGCLLAVVGAAHAARVAERLAGPTAPPLARRSRQRVEVFNLHPDSLTEIVPDLPLAHAVYETLRGPDAIDDPPLETTVSPRVERVVQGFRVISSSGETDASARIGAIVAWSARRCRLNPPWSADVVDRRLLGRALWSIASASYTEQTDLATSVWQRRLFFDFASRLIRVQGQLVPGLFEYVVSGRGVADDNLAWEIFDAARSYPWQQDVSDIPTTRVDGEWLHVGTRSIRFRRRFLRVKRRPVAVPVHRRPRSEDPEDWIDGFEADSICSYPPEDVIVEDYGRFLQHRAVSNLAAETRRTEPFSTSMLDGIDLRETLLNWHEGRIYVREDGRAPGLAGSVIVIFDSDAAGSGFPYLMTWLGEHEQESDMAFYSTDPRQHVVGPGIMRATYGGFMLSYPPGRVYDVWRDPDYRAARSKAEVLTMAAIDYSREKLIVHVANRPPGRLMGLWANRQGKRLVHIPIGSLSPVSLRKLRTVHILAGRATRSVARDYIW